MTELLLTSRQHREISAAIRHLGRAMRALERAALPYPGADDGLPAWSFERASRSIAEASDQLIDGMAAHDGDDGLQRRAPKLQVLRDGDWVDLDGRIDDGSDDVGTTR